MKYMGSKRKMLANGLGDALHELVVTSERFVDLFTGSGIVAWHVAENYEVPVVAWDLQQFAVTLAGAVVKRSVPVDHQAIWISWRSRTLEVMAGSDFYWEAARFEELDWLDQPQRHVQLARDLCAGRPELPVVSAYGGYYFSPYQALVIDSLRRSVPIVEPERTVALASLISAASQCVAAPGHTAQPFQPTHTAARFLFEHWKRDPLERVHSALRDICPRHAQKEGVVESCDALVSADGLNPGDVAFVDPPYSEVQYSRFYHVLETIALGVEFDVFGIGRYPALENRPQSTFSRRSQSKVAFENLLSLLSRKGVPTVLTFPLEDASNGLSGSKVEEIAERYFEVRRTVVNGRFSTLGGNAVNRRARIPAYELILALRPRANRD